MAQRPSIDLNKLTTADRIIVGGAGLYLIWSLFPVWYSFDPVPGFGEALRISAWHGVTTLSVIMSILALAWVGMRIVGVKLDLQFNPNTLDLGIAGIGVLFTLLGLVVQPTEFGVSWGLIIGLLLAIAWTYGAYMKYSEPAAFPPPPVGGETQAGPYNT